MGNKFTFHDLNQAENNIPVTNNVKESGNKFTFEDLKATEKKNSFPSSKPLDSEAQSTSGGIISETFETAKMPDAIDVFTKQIEDKPSSELKNIVEKSDLPVMKDKDIQELMRLKDQEINFIDYFTGEANKKTIQRAVSKLMLTEELNRQQEELKQNNKKLIEEKQSLDTFREEMNYIKDVDPERYNQLVPEFNKKQAEFSKKRLENINELQQQNAIMYGIEKDKLGSFENAAKNFENSVTNIYQSFGTLAKIADKYVMPLSPIGLAAKGLGLDDEISNVVKQTDEKLTDITNKLKVATDQRDEREISSLIGQVLGTSTQVLAGAGVAKPAGMVVSYAVNANEMYNDAKASGLDEDQALQISALYGSLAAPLDYIGVSKSINKLSGNVLKKQILKDISERGVADVLKKEGLEKLVKDNAVKVLENLVAEPLIEGTTEAAQKAISTELKRATSDKFEVPNTFGEYTEMLGKEFKAGALGGAILSGSTTIAQNVLDNKNNFTEFRNSVEDTKLFERIITDLDLNLKKGSITQEEYDSQKANLERARDVVNKIPSDLSNDKQLEAYELLLKKEELEKQIEGKDKALVADKIEDVKKIDEKLIVIPQEQPRFTKDIYANPNVDVPNTEPQITSTETINIKPQENAIPEQSTGEVSVRTETTDSQGVREEDKVIQEPTRTQEEEITTNQSIPITNEEVNQEGRKEGLLIQPEIKGEDTPSAPIWNEENIKTGNKVKSESSFVLQDTDVGEWDSTSLELINKETDRILKEEDPAVIEQQVSDMSNKMPSQIRRALALNLRNKYFFEGNVEMSEKFARIFQEESSRAGSNLAGLGAQTSRSDEMITRVIEKQKVSEVRENTVTTKNGKTIKQNIDESFTELKDIAKKLGIKVSDNEKVEDIINKILNKRSPVAKKENNRVKREEAIKKLKDIKTYLKSAKSTIVPIPIEAIEQLGIIANTYISDGIINFQQLVNRLRKDAKEHLDYDLTEKDIQDIFKGGKPGNYNIWVKEKADATNKLKELLKDKKEGEKKEKTAIGEFTDRLVDRISQEKEGEVKETLTEEQKAAKKKEIINEFLNNIDKYADVVNELKNEFGDKIPDVFNLKFFKNAVKKEISSETIKELIKEHYSASDIKKQELFQSLTENTNLTEEEAKSIQKVVNAEFDAKIKEATAEQLKKLLEQKTKLAPVKEKKFKQDVDKIVELFNLGAFTEPEYRSLVSDQFGLTALNKNDLIELDRLSKAITSSSGAIQANAKRDFLNYLDKVSDLDKSKFLLDTAIESMVMGAISGPTTAEVGGLGSLFSALTSAIKFTGANPVLTAKIGVNKKRLLLPAVGKRNVTADIILKNINNQSNYISNNNGLWTKIANNLDNTFKDSKLKGAVMSIFAIPVYMSRTLALWDILARARMEDYNAVKFEYKKLLKESKNSRFSEEFTKELSDRLKINEYQNAEQQYEAELKALEEIGYTPKSKSLKDFRIREIINSKRNQDTVEEAKLQAEEDLLMGDVRGVAGRFINFIKQAEASNKLNIDDKKISTLTKFAATIYGKSLLLFRKVPPNFFNALLQWSPGVNIANLAVGAKAGSYSSQLRKRVPLTQREINNRLENIAISQFATVLISSMLFDMDDEDNITLNTDSPIKINGPGPGGLNSNAYQKNKEMDVIPWSIQFGKNKPISYADIPSVAGILAPLGIISDGLRYNIDSEGKEKERESNEMLLLDAALSPLQLSQSRPFYQGPVNLVYAATDVFTGDTDKINDASRAFEKMAVSPVKLMTVPALYSQLWKMSEAIRQEPIRPKSTIGARLVGDIPLLENIIEGKRYDVLGMEIKREFEIPVLPYALQKDLLNNVDYREGVKEWELINKFDNTNYRFPQRSSYMNSEMKANKELAKNFDENKFEKMFGDISMEMIRSEYDFLNSLNENDLQAVLHDIQQNATELARIQYVETLNK